MANCIGVRVRRYTGGMGKKGCVSHVSLSPLNSLGPAHQEHSNLKIESFINITINVRELGLIGSGRPSQEGKFPKVQLVLSPYTR
jgi:hypothetical protein